MLLMTSAILLIAWNESGDDVGPRPGVSELAGPALQSCRVALWHAPIYGWLLLVSGWARRATFLWAVLPLIAIQIFEKITFNTSYFAKLVQHRLIGFAPHAFGFHGERPSHD